MDILERQQAQDLLLEKSSDLLLCVSVTVHGFSFFFNFLPNILKYIYKNHKD